MREYNEEWIGQHTDQVLSKADRIEFGAGFICFALVGIAWMAIKQFYIVSDSQMMMVGAGLSFVAYLFIYRPAASAAASLRLQAHTLLCLVQIERNTRK